MQEPEATLERGTRLEPERRGGRVAEGAPLLREYTVYSGIEGSNPSLSAPRASVSAKAKRVWRASKGSQIACTPAPFHVFSIACSGSLRYPPAHPGTKARWYRRTGSPKSARGRRSSLRHRPVELCVPDSMGTATCSRVHLDATPSVRLLREGDTTPSGRAYRGGASSPSLRHRGSLWSPDWDQAPIQVERAQARERQAEGQAQLGPMNASYGPSARAPIPSRGLL